MKNKKILILGGSGMLGWVVAQRLAANDALTVAATYCHHPLYPNNKIQAIKFDAFSDSLTWLRDYDYVINCLGKIRQKIKADSFDDIQDAIFLNAMFPYKLMKACENSSTQCIAIATDCVFSGEHGGYDELSIRDPNDIYGQTKNIGEVNHPAYLNLRCSIVGPELHAPAYSLLNWFLSQAATGEVTGFTDHYWNGVTTYQFAKIVEAVIINDYRWQGAQHLVPADTVTKYALLGLFAHYFNVAINIKALATGKEYNHILTTQNPKVNSHLWRIAGYEQIPSMNEMISELAVFMRDNGIGYNW